MHLLVTPPPPPEETSQVVGARMWRHCRGATCVSPHSGGSTAKAVLPPGVVSPPPVDLLALSRGEQGTSRSDDVVSRRATLTPGRIANLIRAASKGSH